MNTEPHYLNIK